MKALITILLITFTTYLFAASDYYIMPTAGKLTHEGSLNNSTAYGLRLGKQFEDTFIDGLELSYEESEKLLLEITDIQIKQQYTTLNALFNIPLWYRPFADEIVEPYALAGLGYQKIDPEIQEHETGAYIDWGLGLRFLLNDNFNIRLDAKHLIPVDGSKMHVMAQVGLQFLFGGDSDESGFYSDSAYEDEVIDEPIVEPKTDIEEVIEPTPKIAITDTDTDTDGINDSKDKCIEVLSGFKVDSDGSEISQFSNIHFLFNETNFIKEDIGKLNQVAKFMKYFTEYKVVVIGHTDSIGSYEKNQALSLLRAKHVYDALIKLNVDYERIEYKGHGEREPLVSNMLKAGRAKNRRIEIQLFK